MPNRTVFSSTSTFSLILSRLSCLVLLLFLALNVHAFELNAKCPPSVESWTDTTLCENQLPIVWNGLIITEGGSHSAILISSTNEDSIATLNVTVLPVSEYEFELTVCENQLPFTWIGLTFFGPDTQTAVFTNYLNCDSLVTITLTVIPYVEVFEDTVVCADAYPYTWNGITINQAGTYFAIVPWLNNCDIGTTLNVTTAPITSSTTNLTICPSQLPYSWNGLTFTGADTQTATLTNFFNCDSLATLNLSIGTPYTISSTLNICQNQLPYTWNGLTFYGNNTQTANLTSSNGCDSTITLTLIVNAPTFSYAFTTVCQDQLPFVWNGLTYTGANVQSVTLTNAAGCDSVATFALSVNPNTYTYNFMTVCESELPIVWNGLTFTETSIQTAILTNSFDCNFYATLDLVVRPILYSTTNITICETELPYSWNGLTLSDSGTVAATFVSTINCDSIATLNLSVNPTVSSSNDLTICEAQLPYSWNGLTFNSAGSQTAMLVSETNCDSLATLNLTVNATLSSTSDTSICEIELPYTWNGLVFNQAGSQTITLTSSSNCDSLATMNLTVRPMPNAPIVIDSTFYCDAEELSVLTASPTLNGQLTWFSDEQLTAQIGTGMELMPDFELGATRYYVQEILDGCKSDASITVVSINPCPTEIPSAFTPDGDGMNDTWQITDIDINYPNAKIQVFNRWGNLIFEHQSSESNPYGSNAWDGTYEGEVLPVSSYYYLVNFNGSEDSTIHKGTVTIIKNEK